MIHSTTSMSGLRIWSASGCSSCTRDGERLLHTWCHVVCLHDCSCTGITATAPDGTEQHLSIHNNQACRFMSSCAFPVS